MTKPMNKIEKLIATLCPEGKRLNVWIDFGAGSGFAYPRMSEDSQGRMIPAKGKWYTGCTEDLRKRFSDHK